MQDKVSIIILAAGQGTRMRSSTPKVLHTISGKEMLYYSIAEAKKLSDDVTVVLYHQSELVQATMERYFDGITYKIQDHQNFPGTGGAVMGITPKYSKTLILNGDMPLIESKELEALVTKSKLTMSVLNLSDASGYGRVVIKNGKVQKIVEQKDCTNEELAITIANAGIYCIDSAFLLTHLPLLTNNNNQKEYYITDLVEIAINKGIEVTPVVVSEENFKGVNSKIDLAYAESIHQKRIKERWMAEGVSMRLPETIYIGYDVELVGECVIENGVTLLGKTKIIKSHIKAHTVIESSVIEQSDVGPMARIRPQCELLATHIGNFVEVKNGKLQGVKAGHLSYLGDCVIARGTNIGAGTITCNYDGKKKYQTIIGKNVFVGSDTQLVAPLEIPDDVMIAAGTTLTKNPSSGDLVLSRTPQKSIGKFFWKFFGKK